MSSTDLELQRPTTLATKSTHPKTKTTFSLATYRCMIAYRFFLAFIGGYALASLSAMVIAQYFSKYQSSAAMTATMVGFSLHCAAFIWVFMVNKTRTASLGIIIPSLILYVFYKMMGH